MKHSIAVTLFLILAACGNKQTETPAALPSSAGPWTRASEQSLPASDYPAVLATLGVIDARLAKFEGASAVTVRVFRMKSSTVAFEALQKWKPEKGIMHFYRNAYFILAETPDMKFVDAFDKATQWGTGV